MFNPKSLEVDSQLDRQFVELSDALAAANESIRRIEWLAEKQRNEIQRMKDERDALVVFTEAEAAKQFGIEETQLADMRRRWNLPHVKMGKFPRYTKQHLLEIVSLLEVKRSGKIGLKKAA